jgi:GT2 family glycosyltransferase
MQVSVIVLSWNSSRYIGKCLDSLAKVVVPKNIKFVTIVVDNASSDDSINYLKKNYLNLCLIENSTNLGYAAGNNVGIKLALSQGSDFVWIVNPDVEVHPQSLSQLLAAAKRYPTAGIFGSKIYFAPGFEFHKDRYQKKELGKVIWYAGGEMDWGNLEGRHRGVDEVDTGQFEKEFETDFVTGASMFVRRQVYTDVGLLNGNFFLYYEENDFCQRAKTAGWKLLYVPKSIAWHANAQATGIGSPLQDYYITRNRLYFGLRHAPTYTKLLLIKQSFWLYFHGRPWQKRGVQDFYLANMGPGSYHS